MISHVKISAIGVRPEKGIFVIQKRVLQALTIFAAMLTPAWPQTLSNSTLTGKYFLRHIQYTSDNNGNVTDARSITGAITFSGTGTYAFSGQQVIGTGTAANFSMNGTYSMEGSGIVTLTNPQNSSFTINARYGTEAVIGSSLAPAGTMFDLFVAIPAPSASATPPPSNQSLTVNYHMADYELTGASLAQVRVSGMAAQFNGSGGIATFAPLGHGASLNSGAVINTQQYTGNYAVNSDGTGTIAFAPTGGTANAANALLAGATRNLYLSATGNMFLAATPGAHDILIGVQNAATSQISLSGRYWVTSYGSNSNGPNELLASGSVVASASTILATVATTSLAPLVPGLPNLVTETTTLNYAPVTKGLGAGCGCGIGSAGNVAAFDKNIILLGNDGTFVGVSPGEDANGNTYPQELQILAGIQIPNLSGTGVWVNPQGVVGSATYSPVGDNISPGEFISIYGNGLASSAVSATSLPFPKTLGGVSVSINGVNAPLYYVSPTAIICIVPYELTGNSATIIVTNNNTASNSVTVGALPFSPGVISANDYGFGDGVITHANGTLVNSASPAAVNETVVMYVLGLGGLSTAVADGAGATGIDNATAQPFVAIGGNLAQVGYWGLTVDAGLYQINFTIPPGTPSGEQSVAVLSANSTAAELNETVTIAIQ